MNTCKFLLMLLVACTLFGCGNSKDKGVNTNADKPVPADKANK